MAALRSVDFGAEAFPPALFARLREVNPDLHVMNGYGPTEATISCTMQVVDGSGDITIGIPNVNVHVATVDRAGACSRSAPPASWPSWAPASAAATWAATTSPPAASSSCSACRPTAPATSRASARTARSSTAAAWTTR